VVSKFPLDLRCDLSPWPVRGGRRCVQDLQRGPERRPLLRQQCRVSGRQCVTTASSTAASTRPPPSRDEQQRHLLHRWGGARGHNEGRQCQRRWRCGRARHRSGRWRKHRELRAGRQHASWRRIRERHPYRGCGRRHHLRRLRQWCP